MVGGRRHGRGSRGRHAVCLRDVLGYYGLGDLGLYSRGKISAKGVLG